VVDGKLDVIDEEDETVGDVGDDEDEDEITGDEEDVEDDEDLALDVVAKALELAAREL
jgi:hypothetical protein